MTTPETTFKKYEKLKEQTQRGQQTIKEGRKWKILWMILILSTPWLGAWHPFFTTLQFLFPLFLIGFWTLISVLKVEREVDNEIATCVLEGIEFEKSQELSSGHFTKFVDSFNLKAFAFIRASPPMMLAFFLIPKFLSNFSQSQLLLKWTIWIAIITGFLILFFVLMVFVSTPYVNLLKKLDNAKRYV